MELEGEPTVQGRCSRLSALRQTIALAWGAGRMRTIIAASRAPLDKLLAYRARMGWRFEWVSPQGEDFNRDFRVSFTEDEIAKGRIDYNFGTIETDPRYLSRELPGVSVFYKNEAGEVFHTYSTYARGLDMLLGAHHYLDITPEGRNKGAYPGWPRRRDEYDKAASSHH